MAVKSAIELDRRRVREAAVERFDYRRMVDAYEQLYRQLAQAQRGLSGGVLAVFAHPDDESLLAGGALAAVRPPAFV